MGYRQVIILRKDLDMSAGKLMAQANHASMAFLTTWIKGCAQPHEDRGGGYWAVCTRNDAEAYIAPVCIDANLYEDWFEGPFTKTVCEAKNRNKLLKAVEIAEELGLEEGEDYFLIRDNCLTELEPEDEDGRTLTAIGFAPLEDEVAHKISKKFQLFKGEVVASRKQGKWVPLEPEIGLYACSECDQRIMRVECNYCPSCGREMHYD